MDRYVLFAGDRFYPGGGWNDYHSSYSSLEDAQKAAAQCKADWWHIVDMQTGREVADYLSPNYD